MWSLPGNSGGEQDRTLSNTLASVFNSGQRGPIAQLKGSSRLLEICGCKVVQTELIASREYKMIERAELRKEVFDGGFIRQIECVSLCISFQLLDGFLNSIRVA
jgi:hypothetical protein